MRRIIYQATSTAAAAISSSRGTPPGTAAGDNENLGGSGVGASERAA